MKRFTYQDPTGGGDDITLSTPDWVEMPPDSVRIVDTQGERYTFAIDLDSVEEDE